MKANKVEFKIWYLQAFWENASRWKTTYPDKGGWMFRGNSYMMSIIKEVLKFSKIFMRNKFFCTRILWQGRWESKTPFFDRRHLRTTPLRAIHKWCLLKNEIFRPIHCFKIFVQKNFVCMKLSPNRRPSKLWTSYVNALSS
jgi:hypothetical protein